MIYNAYFIMALKRKSRKTYANVKVAKHTRNLRVRLIKALNTRPWVTYTKSMIKKHKIFNQLTYY